MAYLISVALFLALMILGMGEFVQVFINFPSLLLILPAFLFALSTSSARSFHLSWLLPTIDRHQLYCFSGAYPIVTNYFEFILYEEK